MPAERTRKLGRKFEIAARVLAIGTLLGLAFLAPTSYVAVHYSSQPQFCTSCHIMDPYYDSWANSAHAEIACTECHFEPGTMGTLQGKFQALTQLTKYVTRTAGTRPWAHVSDASCTTSGCHSLAELDGPLDFNGIAFDHGPHMTLANGMQLRCVTCHSQVLIDQHFAVQQDVCFTCHFMPGADGEMSPRASDCTLCHGAPHDEIMVAGAPFRHADWTRMGVDCRSCHADCTTGSGRVHPQRCKSCHGQPELLAQIDSPELLHRVHVTDHKLDCFECHVEISHGLAPAAFEHASSAGDCASCHSSPHDAAFLMYAGTGALGIEERPSRMYETRVTCEACHTGRLAGAPGRAHPGQSHIAIAGEVDCLHCHGTSFHGMLGEWQGAVGGGLDELSLRADELRRYLDELANGGAPEARELLAQAHHNIEFVARDGSRGAHNVDYALDALRAAAERIDEAWGEVGAARELPAARALPLKADAACASCHVAVASMDPLIVGGKPFHHERHLALGLDCAACHAPEPFGSALHGTPAFPRTDCTSCHHQESELVPDPMDCASCHSTQIAFLEGTVAGFESVGAPMSGKGCENCHAEPPELMNPTPALCVLCHEEGYDQTFTSWRDETARSVARLQQALQAAGPDTPQAALEAARRALFLIAVDGSGGVHAFSVTQAMLNDALERLGAE